MTDSAWIVVIVLAGGVLEVAGVAFVVTEIASDRRSASELFDANLDIQGAIHSQLPAFVSEATGSLDEEKSVSERVADLERQHEAYYRLLMETTRSTKAETQRLISEAAAELAATDAERDHALRRFIHQQLTGGIRTRVRGVVLILAGIVLTTTGSVWSVLAG